MPLNRYVRGLLSPLSTLYGGLTDLWHGLYDAGWRKSAAFDRFVISVGNLTVGGTGKTPHVEYLLRQLQPYFTLVTLSRGYGRHTKGYRLVGLADTAETV
ncbi:MAG: tetraacyldisaccharide 4'-kinase, partial [Sphingobacteriaceae bacterium]|nr:tetraacyldisaccharide 4'-kinase [Cytophagaceae bacterium]